MAPLRSPILSTLTRTTIQRTSLRQNRFISSNPQYANVAAKVGAPTNQEGVARRLTGTFMMFVPVVALTMFWPAGVVPMMNFFQGI